MSQFSRLSQADALEQEIASLKAQHTHEEMLATLRAANRARNDPDPLEKAVATLKTRRAQIKGLQKSENSIALAMLSYYDCECNIDAGLPPSGLPTKSRSSAVSNSVTYPRRATPAMMAVIDLTERNLAQTRHSIS